MHRAQVIEHGSTGTAELRAQVKRKTVHAQVRNSQGIRHKGEHLTRCKSFDRLAPRFEELTMYELGILAVCAVSGWFIALPVRHALRGWIHG